MDAASDPAARRRRAMFWLKLAVSVVLLSWQARRSDLGELRRSFALVQPGWLLAAFAVFVSSHVLSVYRWVILARPLGFREPVAQFFWYYFSGMFMNLFGFGTVVGDVGRGLFLAGGRRRLPALATVVAQRAVGLVGMAWVGVAALQMLPPGEAPARLGTAALAAAVLVSAAVWWGPRLAVRVLPPAHTARRLVESDLRPLWHDRRQVALSLSTALAYHGLQIGSQVLAARSLGISVPASYFYAFVPLVNLAIMAPLSLSGIGVRELGFRYFLGRVGVDGETGLALGLLGSAITVVTCLLCLPAFLRGRDGAAS